MNSKAIDILIKKVEELDTKIKDTNDIYFRRLRAMEATVKWVDDLRSGIRQITIHIVKILSVLLILFFLLLLLKNLSILEKLL